MKIFILLFSVMQTQHMILLIRKEKEDIACNDLGEKIVFNNIQEAKEYLNMPAILKHPCH